MSGLDQKGTKYPNGVDVPLGKLFIDETAVTSTAAELNILDGVTATTEEVNKLAGVTAGTAAASKALVLGTNKNIDTIVIAASGLKIGSGAGTAVTATAAELNKLAGSGAAVASGTQASVISDPTGGSTQDAEARTAINAIIDALQAFGIVATS